MRPSRRFLWLLLGAVLIATLSLAADQLGLPHPAFTLLPLALLTVAFVIDWLVSRPFRKPKISTQAKPDVFTGETVDIAIQLEGAPPSQNLAAVFAPPAGLVLAKDIDGEINQSIRVPFEGDQTTVSLLASRRGVWNFEDVWLHWTSRFGLVEFGPKLPMNLTIHVVPNIRLATSGQIDLELSSNIHGEKQTAWRGDGSEFHQMNEYVQGMDPRSIDWKRSARSQTLLAKEMRAERNHQIILAMDNGHLMREDIEGLPKIDHMINASLALAWAGVQSGDQVGLFAFDARPRLYSPPRSGRNAFAHTRSQMAGLAYNSIETNHTLALSQLHERLSKRSLIVVFSDFADPLTAQLMIEHLAVMSRRHVIVFVSLKDPLLARLARQKTTSMSDVAQSVSAAKMLEERRVVLETLARLGIHVLETAPGEMTPRLLNTYLAIRAREEI